MNCGQVIYNGNYRIRKSVVVLLEWVIDIDITNETQNWVDQWSKNGQKTKLCNG